MSSQLHAQKRVAVTGLGAICGLGHNVKEIWEASLEGRSGISTISRINTENHTVKIGGEIKNFTLSNDLIPEKDQKKYDLFIHFGIHAANEALKDSGLLDNPIYESERIGAILGVGMGGFPLIEANHSALLNKGTKRVSPFFIPSVIPNMMSGTISLTYGYKGINYTLSSACASSGHAISSAINEIRLGNHDCIITGGAESVLTDMPIAGFANMKATSKRNEEPQKASRPYDADRNGFVMGEGSGVLILEDYDKAVARGAKIYAEIVGSGATSDAYHITAPHPEGEGASRCMTMALKSANIKPEDVGYINTHGTSTPLGDMAEILAIKKSFGDHAKNLCISSTKSMTGHLLGAAGGLESIFCIKALQEGILPPTINLDNQDPECDLFCIPHTPIKKQVEYALNNSFGFGGTNSCLIFKKA